jgi:arylsulfatase A-like enzyme
MVLSFYAPHHPVAPPKPYDTMYDPEDIELPESFDAPQDLKNTPPGNPHNLTNAAGANWTKDQCRDYLRRYYGYVTYLDDQMARVMDALRASGKYDDTIVVFTSDHGDMMCEQGLIYKHCYNGYDMLMKVPLTVQWPGHIKPGSVHEGLASHIDLLPTLLELAGAKIPEGLDGKSMAGVLTGDTTHARDEIFIDVHNQGFAMRGGQWKFVLNAALVNGEMVRKIDELYDMDNDPHEITNLALEPEHEARVGAMRQSIFKWLAESGYPFVEQIRTAAALPMPV